MTKAEFVEKIRENSTKATLTQAAANEIVDHVFDLVSTTLTAETSFRFPGFGTFTLKRLPARTVRHPQTGQALKVKASRSVSFRPATKLRKAVAAPPVKRKKAAPAAKAVTAKKAAPATKTATAKKAATGGRQRA